MNSNDRKTKIADVGDSVIWNNKEYICGWSLHHLIVAIPKGHKDEMRYIKHEDYEWIGLKIN